MFLGHGAEMGVYATRTQLKLTVERGYIEVVRPLLEQV